MVVEPKSEEKIEQFLRGAVVYSDGGARPNPGRMGWGAHGYTYVTKKPTKGHGLDKHILTSKGYVPSIHKDRLSEQIVTPLQYFDFMGSSLEDGSNNVAELDAIYHALERLKQEDLHCVYLLTDSEYVRRGLTEWSASWVANNWVKWDGTPVSNSARWKRLIDTVDYYKQNNIQLDIHWIKGHQNDLGNTKADTMATLAVMYSKHKKLSHQYRFETPETYWKRKVDRNPLLNYRRMYFNSVQKFNTPGKYFQGEPGFSDEKQFGKKSPDTSYSIVELYKPDHVIELIKKRQFDVSNEFNTVMLMHMDEVFSESVYPYIVEHGEPAILEHGHKSNINLYSLNKVPLTEERNPAGLTLRAIEASGYLEELLERFKQTQEGKVDQFVSCSGFKSDDITSVFYEMLPSKKKNASPTLQLKPEYVVGFSHLKVSINVMCGNVSSPISVPLILGTDLPSRNNMKRLESANPSVHLLTWKESEQSIRYACVVATTTGIGIWSNFFANRIFIQPINSPHGEGLVK